MHVVSFVHILMMTWLARYKNLLVILRHDDHHFVVSSFFLVRIVYRLLCSLLLSVFFLRFNVACFISREILFWISLSCQLDKKGNAQYTFCILNRSSNKKLELLVFCMNADKASRPLAFYCALSQFSVIAVVVFYDALLVLFYFPL